jgi:hypothetical protein
MSFNLQNLRTPFSGQTPEGLLPGQLCFNLPDKVVFVGDGTSTKKDLDGSQTLGLPGKGWFSTSLDPQYFLLNPEKYSPAPVDNQILAYSAALGKPVWKDPAENDRPTKGGLRVFTSNATASATTDGGNITDVTDEAISKDGSTFTFQGTAANHCIYLGTTSLDDGGTPLLHTGLDILISSGDLVGIYAVEIWNGSSWTPIGVQAVSDAEGYSYANNLFWRGNSEEKIFYGIRPNSGWVLKTINSVTSYWARIRVITPPSVVPTFETVWLIPQASTSISSEGVLSKLGFSQYGVVNSQGSNIFTELGTLVNYSFTMGDGTGNSYTHSIENVQIGSAGEGLYWQTALTPGICTALPIFIDIGYSLSNNPATTAPVFNLYLTPIENSGTLIADNTGGKLPVQRPESLTVPFSGAGATNPILDARSLPYVQEGKLHRVRFGPFDLSDYYEGDALALFLECVSNGTPTSPTNVWGVAVIGYRWTDGIRGY